MSAGGNTSDVPSVDCARAVTEELIAAGVSDVVLAPGSRSAPLALALAAADRDGRLRLHVRIDERSAGFLALGMARAADRVVPVVTTSGTAVANLHPAVLEAEHAGVPLMIISADRPQTMQDTGANQTTRQPGMFGAATRAEGMINSADRHPASWCYTVRRLIIAAEGARSGLPGPVHLNVALSAPLVGESEIQVHGAVANIRVDPQPPAELTTIAKAAGTIVLAGDRAGMAAARIAELARVPLLAEPSSGSRHATNALSTYRVLLRSSLAAEIRRVIMLGHPTLSRPVTDLLTREDIELIMVTDRAEWPDPGWRVSLVVNDLSVAPDHTDWLTRWQRADAAVRRRLDELPDGSGPQIAAAVLAVEGPVVIGSSNPVRDADLASRTPTMVHANRGLAGIDGTVSTAAGVALATGQPTHLLCGDLTFLHDSNGLLIGPGEPRPDLRIVVVDDDGGSIFATLEQGAPEHARDFTRVFTTPHGTDLAALCAAHHISFREASGAAELREMLRRPPVDVEVIRVPVRGDRRAEAAWVAGLAADV